VCRRAGVPACRCEVASQATQAKTTKSPTDWPGEHQ
jgi:hypothetical protein